MRNSEVLMNTADEIERRGWIRGGGWVIDTPSDRPTCIEGAIQAAAGTREYGVTLYNTCPAAKAVTDFMREKNVYPVARGRLWYWNDLIATSKEQVVEVLRAAAIHELVKEKNVDLDALAAAREVVNSAAVELESVA